MQDGRIVAQGTPAEVVTAELVAGGLRPAAPSSPDPVVGTPLVVPHAPRHLRTGAALEVSAC